MAIPNWLVDLVDTETDKGLWLCTHKRSITVCQECQPKAIETYREAKASKSLGNEDHVNKFKVTKQDGSTIPEDEPYMVFRAQDKFAYIALQTYLHVLVHNGYTGESIEHMQEHILEFQAWQPQKRPD